MSAECLDGCLGEQKVLFPERDLQEKDCAGLARVLDELLLMATPDGQPVPKA